MNIMMRHTPKYWKTEKLGRIFEERKEKVSDKEHAPLSVTKQGVVPQMDHVAKSDDSDNRKRVAVGDFVINSRSDRKGSGGISDYDGSVSLISIVLKPRHGHPRFIHHLLRSHTFQEEFYHFGHGIVADLWTTRFSEMKSILLAIPPYELQKEIADFLDQEIARIDQLIQRKKSFLSVLDEKLQSKADEVDTSVEGKSFRLRHLIRLNPGKLEVSNLRVDQEVTFLPMEAIDNGFGGINNLAQRRQLQEVGRSYTYFAEGDVLLSKVTPCFENGKKAHAVNLINGIGFGTSELHVLRIIKSLLPQYLTLLLSTSRFRAEGCISMTGAGGLKRVSEKAILDFKFSLPSQARQQKIASKILNAISLIQEISHKTNLSIENLRSMKNSLIAEAVTGQLDIQAWKKRGMTDRRLDRIEDDTLQSKKATP